MHATGTTLSELVATPSQHHFSSSLSLFVELSILGANINGSKKPVFPKTLTDLHSVSYIRSETLVPTQIATSTASPVSMYVSTVSV